MKSKERKGHDAPRGQGEFVIRATGRRDASGVQTARIVLIPPKPRAPAAVVDMTAPEKWRGQP